MPDVPLDGAIVECRFCGNRHGVRYYCDATEHALFAAETELADLRAEKERLERERNYWRHKARCSRCQEADR